MQRRGDQPALAQRHRHAEVDAGARPEGAVDPVAVELRVVAQRQGHRLEHQHSGQQAPLGRQLGVVGGEPGQRDRHGHRLAQVVVRNLALGAAHRRGDGLAHGGVAVLRRGRLHGGLLGRDGLDVGEGHRALRTCAGQRGGVDAQLGGTLARDGGDAGTSSRGGAGRCGWRGIRCLRLGCFPGCDWGWAARCGFRRLAGLQQGGDGRAHRHLVAGLDQQLEHPAFLPALDLHRRLGGVDHRDHLAAMHRIARCHLPLQQGAGIHVGAEGGHAEFDHRPSNPFAAATIPGTCGSAASSRCLA
ncbi:hypothetical protein D3C78_711000 [compost metagenome]